MSPALSGASRWGGVRALLLGATLALVMSSGPGCSAAPTTVLLRLAAEAGLPTPDALYLTVFDADGRAVDERRLPAQGMPELPDDVVLYPSQATGTLRLLVRAQLRDAVVGEGGTTVELRSGQQTAADLLITAGRLADRDGDGVPDAVDNCPDQPNPQQGPCAGPDGGVDAGDGPGRDGGGDLRADLPLRPDLPAECQIATQCDDGNPCTVDGCIDGRCVRQPTREGEVCDDGDACTEATTCQTGICAGGAAVVCPPPTTCKTSFCEPLLGCRIGQELDGTSCDDGQYCTVGTTCTGGACGGGTARDCGVPPACHQLQCSDALQSCVASLLAANTRCDDGNACTQDERCDVASSCSAPAEVNELIAPGMAANGRTDRSAVVDGAGFVHAVFHVDGVGVVYATNASGAWALASIDSSAGTFNDAAIVSDGQGTLTTFYVHLGSKELRTATRATSGPWSAPEKVAAADLGTGVWRDVSGTFQLAYSYARTLLYVSGKPGAWAVPLMLDPVPTGVASTVSNGHGPSMARDGTGALHIAYAVVDLPTATPSPIELRHTSNASGSWVSETPAKPQLAGNHGGNPSLAAGKGGALYISHYGANGDVYLTRRTSFGWGTQTLQTAASGAFSSLVLDSNDGVHIAYTQSSGATQLNYATNASGALRRTHARKRLQHGTLDLPGARPLGSPAHRLFEASRGAAATLHVQRPPLRHRRVQSELSGPCIAALL